MKHYAFILVTIALLIVSCGKTDNAPSGTVIAQVNEAVLLLEDLEYSPAAWNALSTTKKQEIVNQWKRLALLSQEAASMHLDDEPAIRMKLENARMKVLANAVLAQKIKQIDVSEEEAFEFYKRNYLTEETELKIQRIFVFTREKLQEAQDAIRGGMKFTDAAMAYSEEAIGKNGGWAGFMSRKELGDRIWNELTKRNPWEYAVVQVDDGYYLILHYRSRKVPTQAADFDDVKAEIEEKLRMEKMKSETEDLIHELEKKANIVTNV